MIDISKVWNDNYEKCPWYEEGDCIFYKLNHSHIKNEVCYEDICPTFFWINILSDEIDTLERDIESDIDKICRR